MLATNASTLRGYAYNLLLAATAAVAVLATTGCAVAADDDEETGDSASEIVTQSTFDKAYAIVKGIDYLPTRYLDDGCYARALYMSMELASNRIESNAIFAFAKDDTHELKVPGGDPGDTWKYHVAPMLFVKTSAGNVPRVLDPAMTKAPLAASTWVKNMGYDLDDPFVPYLRSTSGSRYVLGANYLDRLKQTATWTDTPSFAALKAFKVADVQHACATMNAYIPLEGGSASAAKSKQARLVARTTALVTALEKNGKLAEKASTFDAVTCGKCRWDTKKNDIFCN